MSGNLNKIVGGIGMEEERHDEQTDRKRTRLSSFSTRFDMRLRISFGRSAQAESAIRMLLLFCDACM